MIVTTRNSVYSVIARDNKFHITKISQVRLSPFHPVNHTVITDRFECNVGGFMSYYDYDNQTRVSTARVIAIHKG